MFKLDKKGTVTGVLGGLIASLCCITPLVLIFFGLGGASFALSFVAYKPHFLAASLAFLGLAFWFFIKKKKCYVGSRQKTTFVLTALVLHLTLFFGSLYFLLPLVGPKVFEAKLFANKETSDHTPSCHLTLKLKNLDPTKIACASCAAAIRFALEQKEGVVEAEVNPSGSEALVHYDGKVITSEEIINAVPKNFKVDDKIDQC